MSTAEKGPQAPVETAQTETAPAITSTETQRATTLAQIEAIRKQDTRVESEPDERQPTPGGLADGHFPHIAAGIPVYERYDGQLAQ